MIKHILLSLLLLAPLVSMADDHCTNPMKYTIDKRCYVTDEQKKTTPYNASVALFYLGQPYCSGTIVKGADGYSYLYTAAHCIKDSDTIIFESPHNPSFSHFAKIQSIGDANDAKQDWAIGRVLVYDEADTDIPTVELSNKKITETGIEKGYNARSVGHGGLKIMSDKEISDFKNKYKTFLETKANSDDIAAVRYQYFDELYGDGINPDHEDWDEHLSEFLGNGPEDEFLNDAENLKVSNCKYTNYGKDIHCQAWHGDSGGGVFDKDGNLMAIHTRGKHFIGAHTHAGTRNKKESDNTRNVPIKTLPQPDVTTADTE